MWGALKKPYPAGPGVNRPSPVCEISRVENNRRKSRSAQTRRKSLMNDDRGGWADGWPAPDDPAAAGVGGTCSGLDTAVSLWGLKQYDQIADSEREPWLPPGLPSRLVPLSWPGPVTGPIRRG